MEKRKQSSDLTLDELAQRAGMTARTVRAHQAAGLLRPPDVRGRVGWYGTEHLRRLEVITRLQRRGFSLAAIGELMRAYDEGRTLAQVLGFDEPRRPEVAPTDDWLDILFAIGPGPSTRRLAVRELLPQTIWSN